MNVSEIIAVIKAAAPVTVVTTAAYVNLMKRYFEIRRTIASEFPYSPKGGIKGIHLTNALRSRRAIGMLAEEFQTIAINADVWHDEGIQHANKYLGTILDEHDLKIARLA